MGARRPWTEPQEALVSRKGNREDPVAETGVPGESYARKRRSTRLLQAVPLTVAGRDAAGHAVREQTATLSLNCHGCRYFSRHRVEQNAWLTLEIPSTQASVERHQLRARVAWIQRSRRLQGLFQVGVEVEVPGNVWRSEEHTSELQSRLHLVCRLLLEKKKLI